MVSLCINDFRWWTNKAIRPGDEILIASFWWAIGPSPPGEPEAKEPLERALQSKICVSLCIIACFTNSHFSWTVILWFGLIYILSCLFIVSISEKERVECYPKLRVLMARTQSKGCEACELHRTGRFTVRLSGQLYHNNTLLEDQFMPDDFQVVFHANHSYSLTIICLKIYFECFLIECLLTIPEFLCWLCLCQSYWGLPCPEAL